MTAALDEAERLHDELAAEIERPGPGARPAQDIDGWQARRRTQAAWERRGRWPTAGWTCWAKDLRSGSCGCAPNRRSERAAVPVGPSARRSPPGGRPLWRMAAVRPRRGLRPVRGPLPGGRPRPAAGGGGSGGRRHPESPLRYALVAALDDWAAYVRPDDKEMLPRLLAVARRPTPTPGGTRCATGGPGATGRRRAPGRAGGCRRPVAPGPATAGAPDGASRLREAAAAGAAQYPQDFWLLFTLSNGLEQAPGVAGEHRGLLQAALAVRPATSMVHTETSARPC